MQEIQVQSLGQEGLPENKMATHSSILVWEIPWTEEPVGLQSLESQKSWKQFSDQAIRRSLGMKKDLH